jgi:hypothetical protein
MMAAVTAKARPEAALMLSDPLQRSVLHTQDPADEPSVQVTSVVRAGPQFLTVPAAAKKKILSMACFFLTGNQKHELLLLK